VKLEEAFWDDADVQRLATDQQVEIRARYGGKEEPGAPPSAADVAVVVVARDEDGTALGCGALRALGDGVAEGRFRDVHPALVADTVTTLMLRIGRGDTARATGLDDSAAYRELAALLLHGITR